MTQIKIEVPANDHIALSVMADALQRIAAERAPSVTVGEPVHLDSIPKGHSVACKEFEASINHENTKHDEAFDAELTRLDEETKVDTNGTEYRSAPSVLENAEITGTLSDDTLDADGLPWDKRIHSRGKTRLSDDTWRLARKPNDKTDEEWSAYVESVKSELKAVQDIPTLDEQAVADLAPPVTLTDEQVCEEAKEKLESGEVTIEAPLTPPVAPVTPPTSLTPPVEAPSDQPSVTTFQELMLYMTSDAKKRGADNDMIKATLLEVDPALTAIPLIATRADLIPKFVEALEAKLK